MAVENIGEIRPLPTSRQAWLESEVLSLELRHQDTDLKLIDLTCGDLWHSASLAPDTSSRMQPSFLSQGLWALDLDGWAVLGSRPQLHCHWAELSWACIQWMVRVRLSSHEKSGS